MIIIGFVFGLIPGFFIFGIGNPWPILTGLIGAGIGSYLHDRWNLDKYNGGDPPEGYGSQGPF